MGKIVPSVLSTTIGPRLQAVLKTSGILFPIRTSRPASNVTYMYNMCDFLTQNCNTRLIVPQFKYSMHRLIQKFRVTGFDSTFQNVVNISTIKALFFISVIRLTVLVRPIPFLAKKPVDLREAVGRVITNDLSFLNVRYY